MAQGWKGEDTEILQWYKRCTNYCIGYKIALHCKGQEDGLGYSDRLSQVWDILFPVKDCHLNHHK